MSELIIKLRESYGSLPEQERIEAVRVHVISEMILGLDLSLDRAEAIWNTALEGVPRSEGIDKYITDLITKAMDLAMIESVKDRVRRMMTV